MPCRFQEKYSSYQPYALRNDRQLTPDLVRVSGIIAGLSELVRTGDLHEAHLGSGNSLSGISRDVQAQRIPELSVALVDFHDAMETMLDAANAKEPPAKVVALYPK